VKCSTKTEAPKTSGSKTEKPRIKPYGPVLNGKKQKPKDCSNILIAGTVELQVRFPITRTLKPTDTMSTSSLTVRDGYVTVAIRGFTKADSNAPSVEKFAQSWPIRRAIDVLARAINSELRKEKTTETGY
jgi:hypothetical protein